MTAQTMSFRYEIVQVQTLKKQQKEPTYHFTVNATILFYVWLPVLAK